MLTAINESEQRLRDSFKRAGLDKGRTAALLELNTAADEIMKCKSYSTVKAYVNALARCERYAMEYCSTDAKELASVARSEIHGEISADCSTQRGRALLQGFFKSNALLEQMKSERLRWERWLAQEVRK